MNSQSLCREQMKNGHRCGRLHGHPGAHECCELHRPRTLAERRDDAGDYR